MITKKQAKMIKDTWQSLEYHFNNIDWTRYGQRLLDLSMIESTSHDRFRGDSITRGMSIQQEAKYFAIKRLSEYLSGEKAPLATDFAMIQTSCFMAYCMVWNERFQNTWKMFNKETIHTMHEIASWDYCDLIKSASEIKEEQNNANV